MLRSRLNLEIPKVVRDRVESVMVQTGSRSITETIRRAMANYELIVETQAKGGRVLLEDKNGNIVQLARE